MLARDRNALCPARPARPHHAFLKSPSVFADLTVGAGFDTGTQGAILSIGTNDNLIDRTRIGGKDVSAKGELLARCVFQRALTAEH